LYPKFFISN